MGYCQVVKALVFDINIQRFESFYPKILKMNKYYYKLIGKHKLINFWSFSGNEVKTICEVNYKFIFCFYKKIALFDFSLFISTTKKFFPIFYSISKNNGKFLFVGTKYIFSQSIYKERSRFINKLKNLDAGIFTNFSSEYFKFFKTLGLKKNFSLVIFFKVIKDNFLLLESKKQKIPVIGLISGDLNSCLIDYPIFLNSFYFYNIYIFSRFLFKYILKLI